MNSNYSLRSPQVWLSNNFHLIEIVYLALIAPFVLFPKSASALLLLGIVVLWLLRYLLTGHFVPQTPLDLAIFLLLFMLLLSQLVSYDPASGASKLIGIVWSIAIFFAIVDYIEDSRRHFWIAITGFVLAGVGLTVLAVIGTDWSEETNPGRLMAITDNFPRIIVGVSGAEAGFNANEVAGALLWFLPVTWTLSIAMVYRAQAEHMYSLLQLAAVIGLFLIAALEVVLLLLLDSRAAFAGLVISVILALLFWGRTGRVLVLVLISTLTMGLSYSYQANIANVSSMVNVQQLAVLDGRLTHWARGLTAIRLFPLTGLGLNMYRRVPHILYPQFLVPQGQELSHAHNMYIQVAVDLGLPALISYLAILILASFLLFLAWRSSRNVTEKLVVVGAGIAMLSHAIYGLLDAVALGAKPGVAFWYLLALIASLQALTTRKNGQQR